MARRNRPRGSERVKKGKKGAGGAPLALGLPFCTLVDQLVNNPQFYQDFYDFSPDQEQTIATATKGFSDDQIEALLSNSRVKIQAQCALEIANELWKHMSLVSGNPITHVMHSFGP